MNPETGGSLLAQGPGDTKAAALSSRAMARASGDIIADKYKVLGKKGEGTFSVVFRCQSYRDHKIYAVKRMKQKFSTWEQVRDLQEVKCLQLLNPHPNIINLKEILFDPHSGMLGLVCEMMDVNMYELIKDRTEFIREQTVKYYAYQLLKAIDHMHTKNLFHRDVKPENVLVRVQDHALKLADFGSSRLNTTNKLPFTEYISTRWYRAPECLLTDGYYGPNMDIWSVGCVFFEILRLQPLFPGRSELDQINQIHRVLGTPSRSTLAKLKPSRHMSFNFKTLQGCGLDGMLRGSSAGAAGLLSELCSYDPDFRCNARRALAHSYFKDMRERERKSSMQLSQLSHSRPGGPKSEMRQTAPSGLPSIHSRHDMPLRPKPTLTDGFHRNAAPHPHRAHTQLKKEHLPKLPRVATQRVANPGGGGGFPMNSKPGPPRAHQDGRYPNATYYAPGDGKRYVPLDPRLPPATGSLFAKPSSSYVDSMAVGALRPVVQPKQIKNPAEQQIKKRHRYAGGSGDLPPLRRSHR